MLVKYYLFFVHKIWYIWSVAENAITNCVTLFNLSNKIISVGSDIMIDLEKVGHKIQDLRISSNMSQEELANRLYMTRQAISRYENGLSVPPIDSLIELSRIFSVSFEELLCLNEKMEVDPLDIFKSHDRVLIVNKLIKQELDVDLAEVFYQLSPSERMLVLRNIKDGRMVYQNLEELIPRLTNSEIRFLGGNKNEKA